MGLFGKTKQSDVADLPSSTVVLVEPDDAVWQRQEQQAEVARRTTIEFAPKPPDLVAAAAHLPAPSPTPLRVPWTREAPSQPGLYWWRPLEYVGDLPPLLCVVLDFGGRLCVRRHRGDGSTFVSVSTLVRQWAGPIALADGMQIERLVFE